jgi:hypothetical protein
LNEPGGIVVERRKGSLVASIDNPNPTNAVRRANLDRDSTIQRPSRRTADLLTERNHPIATTGGGRWIRTSSTATREPGISEAARTSRVALAHVRVMLAAAWTAVGDGVEAKTVAIRLGLADDQSALLKAAGTGAPAAQIESLHSTA